MFRCLFCFFGDARIGKGEKEGSTYVMSDAASVWKKSATEQVKLDRKEPMRLHRARRPRNSAQTAKKSAMRWKANIKRVR